MITIHEWRPPYETQAVCGHTIAAGQKACKLTIAVCRDDVACLPQAIKASLRSQQQQAQKPSLLYRLWHTCFGATVKQRLISLSTEEPSKHHPVRPQTGLNSRHPMKTRGREWNSSSDHGEKERRWLLTLLLACLQVLPQKQTDRQPVSVRKPQAPKNVFCYAGH